MLAKSELPEIYVKWNERWGAPFGHKESRELSFDRRLSDPDPARFGPFAFAWASTTRVYEYPWAYHSMEIKPGMRVLDVGGGLGGMQFLLDCEGCEVVNVDRSADYSEQGPPPLPGFSWWLTQDRHRAVNSALGTNVRLVTGDLRSADLEDASFDAALCISVLEHMDLRSARHVLRRVQDLLVPGGRCILSVALFLDLKPFGVRERNHWGINLDVHALVSDSGLNLVDGDPRELLGFPAFDFGRVVDRLTEFFVGFYPCLAQLLVLEKPARRMA